MLSVRKFLFHDYGASIAWMLALGFWLVAVALPEGRSLLVHYPRYRWFGLGWSVLFASLLAWRLHRISHLFRVGQVATARVTHVTKGRNIAYYYTFKHEGASIEAYANVPRWGTSVPTLKEGQSVEVLYDPMRPARSIVRQLFEEGHVSASDRHAV
jgi:hypothetical protein